MFGEEALRDGCALTDRGGGALQSAGQSVVWMHDAQWFEAMVSD